MTNTTGALSPSRARLALVALLCSVTATVLESSAVGVALPAIAENFGVTASKATWVMAGPQLVIVALLLPMAALGESIGYRRVLLASLSVYFVASAVCMAAPGFGTVVGARMVQAIGTAGAMSMGFAMLRSVFSDDRLGAAIGLVAATVAIASSAGPAVAGLILAVASWREVFGLMVVISLLALVLGRLALPTISPSGRPFDPIGSVLVVGMLSSGLLVINGIANGWATTAVLGATVTFGLLLWFVIKRSYRASAPVFPIDLLARPVFALSITGSICAFTGQAMGFIILPFYLLLAVGLSEVQMAFTLSVWPAATALIAPILGRISDRVPAGPTGALGLLVLATGFALIASLDESNSAPEIAARIALCGIGFAIFQTPNNRLIMLSAPRDRSGAASGTLSLARQIGRAFGTAIAAFALFAGPSASLGAMWIAAAFAVLGALASLGRAWALRVDPD